MGVRKGGGREGWGEGERRGYEDFYKESKQQRLEASLRVKKTTTQIYLGCGLKNKMFFSTTCTFPPQNINTQAASLGGKRDALTKRAAAAM